MSVFNQWAVMILFFGALVISLFLGDGKQTSLDVIWPIVTLLLYAVYGIQKRKIRPLPRAIHFVWIITLGYFFVRTLGSDSFGYSVTATIRMVDAYLLYRIFYSLSSKHTARVFYLCILGVIGLATVESFMYIFFPQLVYGLPNMNLLYAFYGHNQLAGLLLFGIPLVMAEDAPLPPWCKKTLFVLFLSGIIFSFARGAWVLAAAYFVFLFGTKRLAGKFNMSLVTMFMGAAAGLLVTMFLLAPRFVHEPPIMNNDWLYKQTIKPPAYENRVQYWLQALRAIQERPIFGSGPGTFYLQSKRLQDAPLSYSWFAHSFLLEQLVELGLAGTFIFVALLVLQGQMLAGVFRTRQNEADRQHWTPLCWAVILTLAYSMYEYNLSFFVILLLFWTTLALLLGHQHASDRQEAPATRLFQSGVLVFLTVYCVLTIASGRIVRVVTPHVSLILFGYQKDFVLSWLHQAESNAGVSQDARLVGTLYPRDPDVLVSLATYYRHMGDQSSAVKFYREAVALDPHNNGPLREAMGEYVSQGRQREVGELLDALYQALFYSKTQAPVSFSSVPLLELYTRETFRFSAGAADDSLYYAKLYYYLGYLVLPSHPEITKQLWVVATKVYPELGYWYAELASLEYFHYGDRAAANTAIASCRTYERARLHCQQILPTFENLPPPGYMKRVIEDTDQ